MKPLVEEYKAALARLKTEIQTEGKEKIKKVKATKRLLTSGNNGKVKRKRKDSNTASAS